MTGVSRGGALLSAFRTYRHAMEDARDPDRSRLQRDAAWSRAAKARARLERGLARVGL